MKTQFRNYGYVRRVATTHTGLTKGKAKRMVKHACKRYGYKVIYNPTIGNLPESSFKHEGEVYMWHNTKGYAVRISLIK